MLKINKTFAILLFTLFSFVCYAQPITIPVQTVNQSLHDQLPQSVIDSKRLIAVDDGHVPPYVIYSEEGQVSGAAIDIFAAIGQILGVQIEHEKTTNITAILMGVQSGRYDLAIGPITDLPSRQEKNDFIAYAASYIAFIVKSGNPHNIQSMADTCGKHMAAPSGAQGVELLNNYSKTCVEQGKQPIDVMVFKDQPSAILAVQSNRADALLGGISILSYYVSQAKGEIELAGVKDSRILPERYHSAVVAKDSPLGPIFLAAFEQLFANGTYAAIMQKWGLDAAKLQSPGINLAK